MYLACLLHIVVMKVYTYKSGVPEYLCYLATTERKDTDPKPIYCMCILNQGE